MAKIVGITGPSGAGKSLLCKYIADEGVPCINADEVYHSMLLPRSPCLDKIAETFGNDVIAADGSLDRAVLSSRVFKSADTLRTLNDTVLPLVITEIKRIISELESKNYSVIALDAPTLIESGFYRECDLVVAVIAPIESRIKRIELRDRISDERARLRAKAQRPDEFYTSVAHITLINDTDEETFAQRSSELALKIKNL